MDDTEHGYSLHKEVRCLTLDTQEGSLLPAMSVLMFGPSRLSGVEESRQVDRLGAVRNAMHASVAVV